MHIMLARVQLCRSPFLTRIFAMEISANDFQFTCPSVSNRELGSRAVLRPGQFRRTHGVKNVNIHPLQVMFLFVKANSRTNLTNFVRGCGLINAVKSLNKAESVCSCRFTPTPTVTNMNNLMNKWNALVKPRQFTQLRENFLLRRSEQRGETKNGIFVTPPRNGQILNNRGAR